MTKENKSSEAKMPNLAFSKWKQHKSEVSFENAYRRQLPLSSEV